MEQQGKETTRQGNKARQIDEARKQQGTETRQGKETRQALTFISASIPVWVLLTNHLYSQ